MDWVKNITHKDLEYYLARLGWKKEESNRSGFNVFIEPHETNPYEIYLPNKKSDDNYYLNLHDAVKALSQIENREMSSVILGIKNVDRDLFNYRITVVTSDSVPIVLINDLLSSTKYALKESARYEHQLYYETLSKKEKEKENNPQDKSINFINECKFAHTWKGSFGITIEVPLYLPSLGLFDNVPETFGRKASKRVVRGYGLVSEAVKRDSPDYILDNISSENDILIFMHFSELQNTIKRNEIDVDVKMSPVINIDPKIKDVPKITINEQSLYVLEKAVDQIKNPMYAKDIVIVGFPETISSPKEDLLEEVDDAVRRVTVKGISQHLKNYTLSLKMTLSLDDYKKAIRAQDEVKNVRVHCDVVKKYRGWEVTKVKKFELID